MNRGEEQRKEIVRRSGVVKVWRIAVLRHLSLRERQDLIDVFELVGVAGEGKVDERNKQARNILY